MRNRLAFVAIAAAAIAARLPFLLRADRFFDADEAVEGLMARHVLAGEHPLFLWGQRYKGVPEIYLGAAAFRAAGSSVLVLKAVTLACFIVFLWLHFRLLERVVSRAVAWIATAFFIAGPPSLVLWSMSGSAEIVMTLLVGAVLLLAIDWWEESLSGRAMFAAAFALGVGLWIQQFILYYVVSLAVTTAIVTPDWRAMVSERFRTRVPTWARAIVAALAVAALLYLVLGLIAFFTGGLQASVFGARITATHPQKMWWVASGLTAALVAFVVVCIFRGALLGPALAFFAGYLPALIGRIGNRGMGSPISRLDASALRTALPDITHAMLPILFGWRDPATRATVLPALALILVLIAAVSYWQAWRRRVTPFFHIFPLVAAVMFFVSGSYIDAQSYRYLMPMYAALPAVYAIGVMGVWRVSRVAGALVLVSALAIFAAQQLLWYRALAPDLESQQAIACLDAAGLRFARAGYWQSYKLTFLTGERIIVSPVDGMDRYRPYSEQTRDAPLLESIVSTSRRCW